MRRALFLVALCLLPIASAAEPSTALDVAPTLVQLKPGAAGMFYVTNHGALPVTMEIEPMDWRQSADTAHDILSPSAELFASPPQVTIASGARQSVRLLATPPTPGNHAYRLLVSELPDPKGDSGHVKGLLQFSVPVFVSAGDPAKATPFLAWSARRDESGTLLCGSILDPMIVTASDLSFGTYLPSSAATASATVTVSCTIPLDLLDSFHVALSAGNAPGPAARYLKHGSDRLTYNIYTDNGYTTVWGNNTGGSTDQYYGGLLSLGSVSFTGWGRLPQGQYVPAGGYSDRITVIVTY